MRFFRASSDAIYESVRAHLDSAWGLPANGQQTCFAPSAVAPHDWQGRPLLSVRPEFCQYEAVAAVLSGLLASNAVEEIAASTYRASLPQTPF